MGFRAAGKTGRRPAASGAVSARPPVLIDNDYLAMGYENVNRCGFFRGGIASPPSTSQQREPGQAPNALKVAVPVPKLSSRNCAFVHVAESAIFRRPAWFAEKLGSKNAEG
jgi:hypothetical protein